MSEKINKLVEKIFWVFMMFATMYFGIHLIVYFI